MLSKLLIRYILSLFNKKISPFIYLEVQISKWSEFCIESKPLEESKVRIFEKFLLKLFIKKIDYCIVMNEYNEKLILQINSRAKIIKNFHPIYELPYSDSSSNIYKKDLNIEKKKTILFFGLIRQYKGLDLLINAIALSKDKLNDLKVLVVGENYQSLDRYHKIIRDCDIEDSFIFVNNFISKADIKKYFLSSDLVVLPYKSASQSGVLSLAYNFNRPVIITDVGGLSDYVSDNKSGFIVQPNSQDISNKINMFFEKNLFEEMSEFIKSDKKRFSWESFEEKLDLYG